MKHSRLLFFSAMLIVALAAIPAIADTIQIAIPLLSSNYNSETDPLAGVQLSDEVNLHDVVVRPIRSVLGKPVGG